MVLEPLDYGKELPVLISTHVFQLALRTIAISFKHRIGKKFWYRLRTWAMASLTSSDVTSIRGFMPAPRATVMDSF